MRPPRHLWRGDWRADSERAGQAAEERAAARLGVSESEGPGATAREADERPRRLGLGSGPRRLAIGGLVVGLLGIGLAAGVLLGQDNGPEPLPAVSSAPLKPGKGQTRATAIYAGASPAVVSVRTTAGAGTGFLIDRDGTLVTNAHVVAATRRVTVRFGEEDSQPADVLGSDPSSDLAVLSVDPKDLPHGVKPLRFADSRTVQVGDMAIAIGNPFGLDRTATEGIVSGLGRHIAAPNGFSIDQVIQTDAPINPGNSGGPLLDHSGLVIGVNSQIATGGASQGGNIGIGFAVPSNTVRLTVPRLKRGEKIPRAYLGVVTAPASPGADVGAEVQSVVPKGPGSRAGFTVGDVILRIDGKDVNKPEDVSGVIAGRRPGDKVEVEVERDGRAVKLEAKLGNRPSLTP